MSAIKPNPPSSESTQILTTEEKGSTPSVKEKRDEPECQSTNFSPQQVSLYECRYENGYDLYDPNNFEWL